MKLPKGQKKFKFFNQSEKRFRYISETGDFSTPVSIDSVADPIAEIVGLIPFIYKNKKKYKVYQTIEDDSFHHVHAIQEIISKTKYHDVIITQIKEAVKKSDYVQYEIEEN
ncbi:hypothetical protein LEP1GSC188_3522 [Leptospira weilii serovar Topaz str. LT2116]|uniref:Uncharacterized protein n=1 Tax=Leptospira weilii serovar Topaz str. LT2116 TaxID=1088540 RepID=M3EJ34_9LEPT|nr:hypothetical protein LEP1GSC188_3522 [Leptospira weilii serovar Topaz str. LT2116]